MEKVLKLKKDQITQTSFLDEAMTVSSFSALNLVSDEQVLNGQKRSQALENKPSVLFWTSLAQAFETQAKESVRSSSSQCLVFAPLSLSGKELMYESRRRIASTFVQTLLSTGYPRLLRLFQEFFSKIAVHTDTIYTLSHQRCFPLLSPLPLRLLTLLLRLLVLKPS